MKTKEELNEIKEEVETLNKKLHELTEEELAQVSGGGAPWTCRLCGEQFTSATVYGNHLKQVHGGSGASLTFASAAAGGESDERQQ